MSSSVQMSDLNTNIIAENIKRRLSWVSVEDFLKYIPPHCVDGREGCAIVGTPGGEAGEFIIMLSVVEKIASTQLSKEDVEALFKEYIEWSGHFYMHSDRHMLHRLEHALMQDSEFQPYFENVEGEKALDEIENFVRMPPTLLKDKLLTHLINTVNLGCGHIFLMRENEEEYGVRRELVDAFISEFYRSLWRGENIDWVVLEGEHNEKAVVNILVDKKDAMNTVPLVVPSSFGSQVFVNHPQAFNVFMDRSYEFVAKIFGIVKSIEKEEYLAEVGLLSQRHVAATLHHLAKGLPVYNVYISGDSSVKIEQAGVVS
jgi:hypothetical protein